MRSVSEADCARLARSAMEAFSVIASAWLLTPSEAEAILGRPVEAARQLSTMGKADALLPETLERVGHLIGIYRTLHTIFSISDQANSWVRRRNSGTTFCGETPLALMCKGRMADLKTVRRYLQEEGLGPE